VAPPTATLFKAFGAGLLAGPPTTSTLPPAASFARAGLAAPPSGAVVILTTFGYQPGKTGFALEGWKALVAHAEANEPGALAVDVTEDAKGSKVHSVQVFDSAVSADAHVNGEAIKANREHNGSARTGERNVVRVKIAYGYLGK
jgi:quinol monooxygenase YgiN